MKRQILRTLLVIGAFFMPWVGFAAESKGAVPSAKADEPPKILKHVTPEYPYSMLIDRVSGEVTIDVIIDRTGKLISAEVVQSSNHAFDKAALTAIKQWQFTPGRKGGVVVKSRGRQIFQFTREEAEKALIPPAAPIILDRASIDEVPQLIKQVPPEHPAPMNHAGIIGRVLVQCSIDEKGRVVEPVVVSSNNPWFERPALEAIAHWEFRPAQKNGQAASTRVQQMIEFQIRNSSSVLWELNKRPDHDTLPLEIRWDVPPEPVASTYPVYPVNLLLAKVKGTAAVSVLVNRDGRAQALKLLEATAPEFGDAAIAAVDAWRFRPATRKGTPCSAVTRMDMEFDPQNESHAPVNSGMKSIMLELNSKEPRIFPLDKLDAMPKPLARRAPTYPSGLLAAGEAGEAMIEFYIDEKGDAQLPRVVSATAREFGFAATQAVAAWRFEPPMRAGQPVIAVVKVPIRFKSPKQGPAVLLPEVAKPPQ